MLVSAQMPHSETRLDSRTLLRQAVSSFLSAVALARSHGDVDRYRVAFSTADSVAIAGGVICPGWTVAVVVANEKQISIQAFQVFAAGDRVLSMVTSFPIAKLHTNDARMFAHAFVRVYASRSIRS